VCSRACRDVTEARLVNDTLKKIESGEINTDAYKL